MFAFKFGFDENLVQTHGLRSYIGAKQATRLYANQRWLSLLTHMWVARPSRSIGIDYDALQPRVPQPFVTAIRVWVANLRSCMFFREDINIDKPGNVKPIC